jgi:hypothetical protein
MEIIITITKTGESTVSVNGVAGPGCKELSASIEKALGQTVKTEFTTEYHQEAESSETQAGQQ